MCEITNDHRHSFQPITQANQRCFKSKISFKFQ